MKSRHLFLAATCLFAALTVSTKAWADTVAQFDDTLSSADSTQKGRMSRSGVPSDWSVSKPFPGFINTTTNYVYKTYDFSSFLFVDAPYVQIDIFDYASTGGLFLSAYSGTYDPLHPGTNYLGDAGSSPDYFGIDAVPFQVVLPTNTDLILVLNETLGGASSSLSFTRKVNIEVERFADTDFDDPPPTVTPSSVPEPSSLVLLGSGMAGVVEAIRRKVRAA